MALPPEWTWWKHVLMFVGGQFGLDKLAGNTPVKTGSIEEVYHTKNKLDSISPVIICESRHYVKRLVQTIVHAAASCSPKYFLLPSA